MGNRKTTLLAVVLLAALLLLLIWWQPSPPGGPEAPDADPVSETKLLPLTLPPVVTMPTAGRTVAGPPDRPSGGNPTAAEFFGQPPLMPGETKLGTGKERRPVWLTGVLTGPDGEPLAGVTIRLEPEIVSRIVTKTNRKTGAKDRVQELDAGHRGTLVHRGGRLMIEGRFAAKTDAQGRFEIPAPEVAGSYHVSFHPAGKAGAYEFLHRTGPHRYTPDEPGSLGAVRLPEGATIRGVVVDGAGEPVEGASVSYWPDRFGRTGESLKRSGEAPADRVTIRSAAMTSSRHGLGRVETDNEGRFSLGGVIPGAISLLAVAPSTTKVVKLTGYHVNEGEEIDGVRFVVSRVDPPILAGHVRDRDTGEPIQALIRLKLAPGSFGGLNRCRADGSFLIGRFPPGARLHVRAKGYEPAEFGPYTLGDEERKTGVDLRLRAVKE